MIGRLLNHEVVRFVLAGAVNTIGSYAVYLLMLQLSPNYQLANFISYVVGILISYYLNARFVFKGQLSLRTFLQFPLVYVVQFVLTALLLWLVVERLGIQVEIAQLVAVALTLPITFVLSRTILKPRVPATGERGDP